MCLTGLIECLKNTDGRSANKTGKGGGIIIVCNTTGLQGTYGCMTEKTKIICSGVWFACYLAEIVGKKGIR